MHHPVLLSEVIAHLNIKKDGRYIDATLGEGGYTREILELGGKVLGIDLDQEQIANIDENLGLRMKNGELKLVQGNFANIEEIAKKNNFFPVDGIVFDLGLSLRQLKESGKGLSYKKEQEYLDMRLGPTEGMTVADYINTLKETELYELFAKNSEELNSRTIAVALVGARAIRKIKTVSDLVGVIDKTIGRRDEHVLRRIFQALRIEVNQEFDNLKSALIGSMHIVKNGGRILVVTFHSLEDRIVKQIVRERKLKFETKKPVISKRESRFERSAKLRIIIC